MEAGEEGEASPEAKQPRLACALVSDEREAVESMMTRNVARVLRLYLVVGGGDFGCWLCFDCCLVVELDGNVAIEGMPRFQGLGKFKAVVGGMSVKEEGTPKNELKGDIEEEDEEEEGVVKWIGKGEPEKCC